MPSTSRPEVTSSMPLGDRDQLHLATFEDSADLEVVLDVAGPPYSRIEASYSSGS